MNNAYCKIQSVVCRTFSQCVTCKKLFTWCIMPKRPSKNHLQSKKIKISKTLSTNITFLHSKNSDSNLLQKNKMTVSSEGNEKKEREIKVEYLDTPVKSESDKKEYRVIKLENGLIALLVSDINSSKFPEAEKHGCKEEASGAASTTDDESEDSDEESDDDGEDEESEKELADGEDETDVVPSKPIKMEEKMAACALCVGVGSFSDPMEIQGMAHFLEHMVFMGSKKFPEENDFDSFIKKRGGSDNACTDCEQTTFHFEIQEKHLLPAMDRFAQFFINPLMKRDAITREREAVESEFKMNLPSDYNRKEQLFSSFARTNHPARKFTWGNLITLRDNIEEDKLYSELHKFRERHYSAHRMTLAVQARLSLDTLEQYVKDCFADVPVNHLPADDFSKFKGIGSFDNPDFRKICKIKPVKDVCQVELTWVMPPLHHLYKSKPHQYVSWIIGHEGKGSLISYLRKKMWCLDIFSGNGEGGFEHSSMYALFSLSLILTDEGHKHLKEVLEAVFSYINMLRKEGPQKRIFEEIQQIENINFRFTDEDNPVDYVESLCESMHFYPPTDYITGSNLYFEYDPESIKDCISALSPDNVNIIILDKKFNEEDFDKIEPWFQTKYSSNDIPDEWAARWKTIEPLPEFHLPNPNVFITDDFSLIDLPEDVPNYPTKIHSDDITEIWHRPDPKFRLPECYMYLNLVTPYSTESPRTSATLNLVIAILKQLVAKELYDASAAELNYEITPVEKGITVKVHGFNQKLPLLLKSVLKYIADCHKLATEELFNVIKKELLKSYYNNFLKPAKLTKDVRLSILTSGLWISLEKHSAISDVSFEEFVAFSKNFTRHIFIQCLVQGNMSEKEVLKNVFECIKPLQCGPLVPNSYPQIRVCEIPVGEKCCRVKNFNSKDCNSVVTNYYQSGLSTIELSVVIELLMLIMEEPLFDKLRTQEQLGYNVFCLFRNTFGVYGYSISVCTQANKFTTEHVDKRIESFIQGMITTLKEMPEEEYNFIKESLVKLKQCPDVHLKEEVNRNWGEIIQEDYIFDRFTREIALINDLKIAELQQWIIDHSVGGKNFRKLTVQIVGTANEDGKENKEHDLQNLKENLEGISYSLNFLKDEDNNKPTDYFITDIEAFKSTLAVYPTKTEH